MVAKLARSQRTASRASESDEPTLLKVGDLLAGKYRVERLLGEGGMGIVVEAHHQLLGQNVAVKLLYRDVADEEAKSRLLLEARAAARLQSEHVARVIDVDVGRDGLPFIVMELLEGADLCQIADARGALPRTLVVDYVLQALEGLAHAHGCSIIHRDLKPSNLFLTNKPDGTQVIKILDFGISKSPDEAADRHTQQLTGGRTMLGSPPYMSPEQVRSPKTVDHRTDIWSIGICLYELLTNAMPFGGDELQETFAQILEKDPPPIRALVPTIPEDLEAVILRCLAKNREARFADVAELASALAPFGSGAFDSAAERTQAILARALMEDLSNSARPRAGNVSERIAIPSSPGRRLDSVQPELHGTASTVAGRFTSFGGKRHWLAAAMIVPALVGIFLIRLYAFGKTAPLTASVEDELSAPPSTPTTLADAPIESASAHPAAAGSALEHDPLPSGTIIGASPMPDNAKAARGGAGPAASGRAGGAIRPLAKAPATAAKALPPGLPQTRSGQ